MTPNNLLLGAALGAGMLFLLDPQSGRGRRARARDQVVHWSRKSRAAADVVAKDLANRTRGVTAATRRRLQRREVDDVRVLERVRAKLGRVTSHPRAVEVEVDGGDVMLRGPVLAAEMNGVISAIEAVPGVRAVINMLEPRQFAEDIPGLQGEGPLLSEPTSDLRRRTWVPGTRALVAVTGIAATGLCLAAYARRG